MVFWKLNECKLLICSSWRIRRTKNLYGSHALKLGYAYTDASASEPQSEFMPTTTWNVGNDVYLNGFQ